MQLKDFVAKADNHIIEIVDNLCRNTAKKSKEWFTTILKMDDKINAQTLYSNSLKTNIPIDNNLLFCHLLNVYIIMKLE